nr:LysR substrate-binding domain-containing protein [Secundilactobacillus oryzae]
MDFEEFTSIHLGKRPFNIIASPDNQISKRSSVKFAELKDQDFINLDSKYVHPLAFKAYSESAGVTPRVTYTPPDIAWVKGLLPLIWVLV